MSNDKRGFLYGVGANDVYMKSAKVSASSIKDYFPEANITLCAPSRMVDADCRKIFDNIIDSDFVPDSPRTKLWALSQTPYDITMYLDADTVCMSEEISKCFDQIKDLDLVLTKIRLYNSNPAGIVPHPEYKYHGGVALYNRNAIPFMIEWWNLYQKGQLQWDYPEFNSKLRVWDQFYLFYLLTFTKHGLKVGTFDEDARWNFVNGYFRSELNGKPEIIRHNTLLKKIKLI